jgi:hypothetical protein
MNNHTNESNNLNNAEVISDAIGNIQDSYIESAEVLRSQAVPETPTITVTKRSVIWHAAPAMAAGLILAVGMGLLLMTVWRDEAYDPNRTGSERGVELPNTGGYTWHIEPTLDLDSLNYCWSHDVFYANCADSNAAFVVDETTGQLTGEKHLDDCGRVLPVWVYDRELDLFGYVQAGDYANFYPMDEAANISGNQILAVHSVDSSEDVVYERFTDEAYTGEVAAYYRGNIVSDFSFSGGGGGRLQDRIMPFTHTEGVGVLNASGGVVVRFDFDDILLISDGFAFAKRNGLWGIISFSVSPPPPPFTDVTPYVGTPPPPQPPPPPPPPPVGVSWFVEPTNEFGNPLTEWFGYCPNCDVFIDGGERIFDERTGQPTDYSHSTHGGAGDKSWVYDTVNGLFGHQGCAYSGYGAELFPVSELAERFPHTLNKLIVVSEVRNARIVFEEDWGVTNIRQEHFTGYAAAFYNGKRITEFEHDELRSWVRGRYCNHLSLARDERYGVVNHYGEVVVPFVYDDILVIDDYTAFAIIDGAIGIITWVGVENVPHRETNVTNAFGYPTPLPPPPTGPMPISDEYAQLIAFLEVLEAKEFRFIEHYVLGYQWENARASFVTVTHHASGESPISQIYYFEFDTYEESHAFTQLGIFDGIFDDASDSVYSTYSFRVGNTVIYYTVYRESVGEEVYDFLFEQFGN